MSINIELLKKICEESGAPGYEQRIREFVRKEVEPYADSVEIDNIGNLIAFKKGKSDKKVMVAAHMDEIGFIVTHIDNDGFVRFHTLGGFDPKTLTSQRVIVHGKKDLVGVMGSKPVHVMSTEEKNRPAKIGDYFIDLGMTKEEVEEHISVGDTVTRERGLVEIGNCVNCKSLDNRVSVYILIETLKRVNDLPFDLYAAFTVQEEVGLRGAHVATHRIQPDFGFGLDTTIAYDTPGSAPHERITTLGEGVGIKIMDSSAIADRRMVRYLKQVAEEEGIDWQPEILTAGGTDTAAIQRMGEKCITGAISIPTRHIHQVIEMVHKDDIGNAVDLLQRALEKLDKLDKSN